ncbi:hypothetical protein PCE01_07360 [Pediococcus cellicola]|nr:hypothetical protein PCE01_07360 [Pediococcus cellicola]
MIVLFRDSYLLMLGTRRTVGCDFTKAILYSGYVMNGGDTGLPDIMKVTLR